MERSGVESVKYDFDYMAKLAKTDPEEFERIKRALIDKLIHDASPRSQARLRGFQFKIDAILGKYKDPIARKNKMVELLWKGVGELADVLNGEIHTDKRTKSATVIPLFKFKN